MNLFRELLLLLTCFCCYSVAKLSLSDAFETHTFYKSLLRQDDFYLEFLDVIIEKEEKRLTELKRGLAVIEKDIEASGAPETYVGDLNKSFKLMKRMTFDWITLVQLSRANISHDVMRVMNQRHAVDFKTTKLNDADLKYSIDAIHRLRRLTQVSISEFADGNLGVVKLNSTLSAHDCYTIGVYTLKNDQVVEGVLWMIEGLHRLKGQKDLHRTFELVIKDLARVYFKTGYYNDIMSALVKLPGPASEALVHFNGALAHMDDDEAKAEDNNKYAQYYEELPSMIDIFGKIEASHSVDMDDMDDIMSW